MAKQMSLQAGAPSDDELRNRTEQLLKAAESISLQLALQTSRLAAAIELFDQEIISPLRQELRER